MSNRLTQMNYFVTQVIERGLTQDNQAPSRWFRTNRAWRIPTGQAVGQFEMHQRHQDPHHVQDQAAGQGAHCVPEALLQARAALRLMRAAFDCARALAALRCRRAPQPPPLFRSRRAAGTAAGSRGGARARQRRAAGLGIATPLGARPRAFPRVRGGTPP